ncbi:MAG: hemolysin family protein [Desulfobaccales bacterium]
MPLLLLEGFFAAAEIALVSANRRRLQVLAEEGHRGAKFALKLLAKPEYFLATTLVGAYMAGMANTVLVTALLLQKWGATGEVAAMLLLPPLLLILGEITPKSIGRQQATALVLRLGPVLWVISWIFYPVTFIFALVSRSVLFLTGVRRTSRLPFITREDLRLVVQKSGPEVDLEKQERLIIHRILQFSLRTVKEVMVPLVRVAAVPDTLTVGQALEEFRAAPFARFPVYHRRIDNLSGVLHSFDLLGEDHLSQPIKPYVRPLLYVPEIKKIDRLLTEMQRSGTHLAAVVDEYGGAVGIVTLEDLLEEIVGEIADEFDQEAAPFKKLGEGHYLINARMEIGALNEFLHLDLPPGDYETLAGFLISQLGDLPRPGEQIKYRNLRFIVRQAEARTLKEVEVFVDYEPV